MAEIVTVVGLDSERGLVGIALVSPRCKSCRGGHCARSPRTLSARIAPEIAARIEVGCGVRIGNSSVSIVRALFRLLVAPFAAAGAFGIVARLVPDGGEENGGIAAFAAAAGAVAVAVVRGNRLVDLPIVGEIPDERPDAYPTRSRSGLAEAKLSHR